MALPDCERWLNFTDVCQQSPSWLKCKDAELLDASPAITLTASDERIRVLLSQCICWLSCAAAVPFHECALLLQMPRRLQRCQAGSCFLCVLWWTDCLCGCCGHFYLLFRLARMMIKAMEVSGWCFFGVLFCSGLTDCAAAITSHHISTGCRCCSASPA
jgi:hypothetical protein